jgi:hypothetical protein
MGERQHEIMVRLSDEELARFDELRPSGTPRATFLRSLLQEIAPKVDSSQFDDLHTVPLRRSGNRSR